MIPHCFVQAELDEIGVCAGPIDRLAVRLVTKQAVLKAIDAGFRALVAFTDVMIERSRARPLEVGLSGDALRAVAAFGVTAWRLSIKPCQRNRDNECRRIGRRRSNWQLLIRRRTQKGDAPRIKINGNTATTRCDHRPPHVESMKNGPLPLSGGTLMHFQMGCHALDGPQQLRVHGGHPVKEVMATGVVKH